MDSEIDVTSLVIRGRGISAAQIETLLGAPASCTSEGEISFFKIVLPESKDTAALTGELIDWCGFLFERSKGLRQLSGLGCETYLDCQLMSDNVFIDVEVMDKLAKLDIGISVWFKFPEAAGVPEQYDYQLEIPEPLLWYSQADETAFFKGLTHINAIKSFKVRPGRPMDDICNHLILFLDRPIMHDNSLIDLIGLMYRYSLDMSCLAAQCTTENAAWFKDPTKYWYQAVFGDQPPTVLE